MEQLYESPTSTLLKYAERVGYKDSDEFLAGCRRNKFLAECKRGNFKRLEGMGLIEYPKPTDRKTLAAERKTLAHEFHARIQAGESVSDISRGTGHTERKIRDWMRREGLGIDRTNAERKAVLDRCQHLIEDGCSLIEAARRCNVSRHTLRSWMNRFGYNYNPDAKRKERRLKLFNEAVRLVNEEKVQLTQAARDVGVSRHSLRTWMKSEGLTYDWKANKVTKK